MRERKEAERLHQEALNNQIKKCERLILVRRILAVTIFFIGLSSIFSFANDLYDKQNEVIQKQLQHYEQVKIRVYEDETAWEIESKLLKEAGSKEDVRDVLFFVEELNGINLGDIKAGEEYIFLKPKN